MKKITVIKVLVSILCTVLVFHFLVITEQIAKMNCYKTKLFVSSYDIQTLSYSKFKKSRLYS